MRVKGVVFRVESLGFRVQVSGFRVQSLGVESEKKRRNRFLSPSLPLSCSPSLPSQAPPLSPILPLSLSPLSLSPLSLSPLSLSPASSWDASPPDAMALKGVQIVRVSCLDLYHKSPDSGEREYKSEQLNKNICWRCERRVETEKKRRKVGRVTDSSWLASPPTGTPFSF